MLFSLIQYSGVEQDYAFFIDTVTNSKAELIVLVSFWIFTEASNSLVDCGNISSEEIIQTTLKTGQKSVRSDGMHTRVLKDLANFTVHPLPVILKSHGSWARVVGKDKYHTNIKKEKNLDRLVNLLSASGKVMMQIFPGTFSNCIKQMITTEQVSYTWGCIRRDVATRMKISFGTPSVSSPLFMKPQLDSCVWYCTPW